MEEKNEVRSNWGDMVIKYKKIKNIRIIALCITIKVAVQNDVCAIRFMIQETTKCRKVFEILTQDAR